VRLSETSARALGAAPPEGSITELFLDDQGRRFQVKGQWPHHARNGCATRSQESLSLFMYREPSGAERSIRRHFRATSMRYQQFLEAYARQDMKQRLANPVCTSMRPSAQARAASSFTMLLNLVSAFERRECRHAVGLHRPLLAGVDAAEPSELHAHSSTPSTIFRDFVLPKKNLPGCRRTPSGAASWICARPCRSCRPTARRKNPGVVYEIGRRPPSWTPRERSRSKTAAGVSLDWFNMPLPGAARRKKARASLVRGGLRAWHTRRHDRWRVARNQDQDRSSVTGIRWTATPSQCELSVPDSRSLILAPSPSLAGADRRDHPGLLLPVRVFAWPAA